MCVHPPIEDRIKNLEKRMTRHSTNTTQVLNEDRDRVDELVEHVRKLRIDFRAAFGHQEHIEVCAKPARCDDCNGMMRYCAFCGRKL